jgi:hypothetical protein
MATTVGQHSVASFTSPVNGTTPIDANSVRGNDNTLRSSYVDHDADTGIHVQSSTLAARPAAGTAGRKWITEDSGVYTLWFDDGTNWHPVSSENVALTVLAGENLAKGDVVKVTGWNNGQDLPEVVKTTSASDTAFAIITATVTSGAMGYATNTGIVQDVNTNAYSVGAVLYPNASGGFTSTKPTSGQYQVAGYVLRQNTNNGVIFVEFSGPRIVESSSNTASTVVLRDASGNFSAGTVTATTLAGTLSTAAQPNVTSVGTLSSLTVSGDLTVDTSTLKVDSTNNRVGIGTASPEYTLDSVSGDGNLFRFDRSGVQIGAFVSASNPFFGTLSNSPLLLMTNSTEKVRIDASGNLGIGVTPSAWVAGARAVQLDAYSSLFESVVGKTTLAFNAYESSSNSYKYLQDEYATMYQQVSGTHAWFNAASGTTGNAITFTQAMTLDASGNLLVGATANPGILNKSIVVDSGSSSLAGYILQNDTTGRTSTDGSALYISGGSVLNLYNLENAPMLFGTNNAERARITSGGKFGVGAYGTITYLAEFVETSGADRDILLAGVSGATNGLTVKWNHSSSKTYVNIANIPTSSAGLPTGTLYSDSGTIKIA